MTKIRPTNITADRNERVLIINWSDGSESRYPFAGLRAVCPCAGCKGGHANMGGPADKTLLYSAEDADLTAVRVSGELQIDPVLHRLGKRVGMVREQDARFARGSAAERARNVHFALGCVVDPREPEARPVAFDSSAFVHEQAHAVFGEVTTESVHVFARALEIEQIVIARHGELSERWIEPLEHSVELAQVFEAGRDEIAAQTEQVGLGRSDSLSERV